MMMPTPPLMTSLGWRSELLALRNTCRVQARDRYWGIRSPDEPDFYWGNFLLYPNPPDAGALAWWEADFAREFGIGRHRAFAWLPGAKAADSSATAGKPTGLQNPPATASSSAGRGASAELLRPFVATGYDHEITRVLAADSVVEPKHLRSDITVRPLQTDSDWAQQLALTVQCRDPVHPEADFAQFAALRQARLREAVADGWGAWFGALRGEKLLASAGLLWDAKARLGRLQLVMTAPQERRSGLCQTVVHQLSRFGLVQMRLDGLIIHADEDRGASRIYESMGYRLCERLETLLHFGHEPAASQCPESSKKQDTLPA